MIKKGILSIIVFYKNNISPFFSHGFNGCRFYPSCSEYAFDAVSKKGPLKGILMAIWRVLRCNPMSKGGVDKVN